MSTEEKEVKEINLEKLQRTFNNLKGNLEKNGVSREEGQLLGALLLVSPTVAEEFAITEVYTDAVELIGEALSMLVGGGDDEDED